MNHQHLARGSITGVRVTQGAIMCDCFCYACRPRTQECRFLQNIRPTLSVYLPAELFCYRSCGATRRRNFGRMTQAVRHRTGKPGCVTRRHDPTRIPVVEQIRTCRCGSSYDREAAGHCLEKHQPKTFEIAWEDGDITL